MKDNPLYVVIYSGGMDSFTTFYKAAFELQDAGFDPQDHLIAVTFDYGQRHRREIRAAQGVTQRLGIRHDIIDLTGLSPHLRGSALTSPEIAVPEGHYQAETMRATVVPGRNTMMLGIALAFTESRIMTHGVDSAVLWYGAHSGDHHIYPDCRPEYVSAMGMAIHHASDGKIELRAPYLHGDKETILLDGMGWGLDYAQTWTCYVGGERPCGRCGACQERAEAFKAIGKRDPLLEEPETLP